MSSSVRFTVLTPRLLRLEWQPAGRFEDRPTQWIVNRALPEVPHMRRTETDGRLVIETEALVLTYTPPANSAPAAPLSARTLSITLKPAAHAPAAAPAKPVVWRFGDANSDNLGGTARTLDECDGPVNRREGHAIPIHPGIFSRSGWAVLDDSASLVLDPATNLPVERSAAPVQDLYFFAYGADYAAGLRDFYALTGRTPMLPAWTLGLWWSRWEKYNAEDLRRIVGEFEEHDVPLSTLVIDMDWHVVKNEYTNGWTGYSWNKDFFPDPAGFFAEIHRRGIRACLNLHPADGCHPHENAYADFARFMGVDPASKQPILFNPTDPKFLEGYFKFLHHPHEQLGVDFWWIDWQQGKKTPFGDVDPLWVLNHLHSADLARDGRRRPLTFSRWCGAGAHRYPIGFSGDTYRTWRTLRYEVEFTARASNLGFGWWSHDIGAFARGHHDDELYVRWVQFGSFSPILRLHNAGDPTVDHRPWSKESRFAQPALDALKLRRALLPYLYACARANADGGLPLVRPMYYHHAADAESYRWPSQYYFGPDLLVSPVARAAHPETHYTLQPVWLPAGEWREFSTGAAYPGGRVHGLLADLSTIPAFVRAGAIIPTVEPQGFVTELVCFPGAETSTELYTDDGESLDFQKGQFARHRVTQRLSGDRWTLTVERTAGDFHRRPLLGVVLRGYDNVELTALTQNGKPSNISPSRSANGDLYLQIGELPADGLRLEATLRGTPRTKPAPTKAGCTRLLQSMPMNCHFVRPLLDAWDKTLADPTSLARFVTDFTEEQLRVLINYLYDAGSAVIPVGDHDRHLVWWNAHPTTALHVRASSREECFWNAFSAPADQRFGSHPLAFKGHFFSWRAETDLLGVATLTERENDARDLYGDA